MLRRVVSSSSLVSIGYENDGHGLEIEFWHGGVYLYRDVPREIYDALMRSPTKGAFFNEEIRDRYVSEQVD